ncbi:MAG: ACP S-malonyltransferase [Candidatus Binatia bacterium]
MSTPVAFLFPGQGSQAVGMGKQLCARFAAAREVFSQADDVLGFPLSQLCFEGPAEELTLTANTQPALLTASYALTRVLHTDFGLSPSWAAGHSVGEFSALLAAGAFTFSDALEIVRERGRAMQAAVPPGVGAMAAVLGLNAPSVAAVCREAADGEVVTPANLNGGGQVVIAGHRQAVERAAALAKTRGAKRVVPLSVSAPFHCALMGPAAERLRQVLEPVPVAPLQCSVISNVEATAYRGPARVKELLVRQVVHPVRWQESVEELQRQGCVAALEVGPGRALTGLVKRIAPHMQCAPAEDLETVRHMLGSA